MIGETTFIPDPDSLFVAGECSAVEIKLLFLGDGWLLIEMLFFETFIFVSFSVYSNSVRLNSSK